MDPITLGVAGGTAIAGLFGGIHTNEVNKRIARETNAQNYKMFQEQNAFNLEMWKRANDYNTPFAQRERLEQAGINPYLALGNVTTGTAQGVSSATPAPAVGYSYANPVSPALSNGMNALIEGLTAKRIEADIKKVETETQGLEVDNNNKQNVYDDNSALAKSQTALNYDTATRQKIEAGRIEELLPVDKQRMLSDIDLVNSQSELNKLEQKVNSYYFNNIQPLERQKIAMDISHLASSIVYMGKLGRLTDEQVELATREGLLTIAKKNNVVLDSYEKIQLMGATKDYVKSQTKLNKATADYTDARRENIPVDNFINGVNATVNVFEAYNGYRSTGAYQANVFDNIGRNLDQMRINKERNDLYKERTEFMRQQAEQRRSNRFPYRR